MPANMSNRGLFIVIEGSDGSGKATQLHLLAERLKAIGYDVAVFDFPRYLEDSSYFVRNYLNGVYGPAASISPYTASLFYALDRFEASKKIKIALDSGKIVLSNRYVGSNMAHQGGKILDPAEQRGFFVWEDNLEFELLKIPRPDLNIFLRVPAKVAYENIKKKSARSYTDKSHDEHENDINHLRRATATYDLLCQLFPKDFKVIECTKSGKILDIPRINNLIWESILAMLPREKPNPSHSVVVSLSGANEQVSSQGKRQKNELLHEFKKVSLFLRLQVEHRQKAQLWPKLSSWRDSDYAFYTPQGMPKELVSQYKATMANIADLHNSMREKIIGYLEKHMLSDNLKNLPSQNVDSLLMPATPLAALCTFDISVPQVKITNLARDLLSNDAEEAQWAAKQLYLAARTQWPKNFKESLETNSAPESINHIISKLASGRIGSDSNESKDVKLLETSPRQEFDLVAESIYPFSTLSLDEIVEEVASWPYSQKYESLHQVILESASALSKVHYKLDVISDQITLSEVVGIGALSNLQVQYPSPRYGYDVPAIFEQAEVDDLYIDCFDQSLKLYSLLQSAGRDDLAVYAALLGHRVRSQFNVDAQNIYRIINHKGNQPYQKLSEATREKVSEAHPLMWDMLLRPGASPKPAMPPDRNRVKAARRPNQRGSSKTNKPK